MTPGSLLATFVLLVINRRYGVKLRPSSSPLVPDGSHGSMKSARLCFRVRGLGELCGFLDPMVVSGFRDSVITEMGMRVEESGGILEASEDGTLRALFGAAGAAVRYPAQAVQCAQRLIEGFHELIPELLDMGVAISCGAGIAWGSDCGRTRELASALESAAIDNGLLVSPEIAVMTGDRWTWEPAVIPSSGLRAMVPGARKPHLWSPSFAPGHPVRQQMADAWQRFLDEGEGASGGVAIVGDPGLGKNELAEEFASCIAGEGEVVAVCCGSGRECQPPMGMWFVIAGDNARTGDEHLPLWLAGALTELAGDNKRAVVLLSDVHNADEASLKVLARLLAMPPDGLSLFFILVGERLPEQLPECRLTVVSPIPLQRAEIMDFIQEVIAGGKEPGFTDTLASHLMNSTMGYPLFVHHALLHMISEGLLVRDASGIWKLPATLPGISPTVEAALQTRIGALPRELREGLSLAGLLGRCFPRELFLETHRAFTGSDGEPVLEGLVQTAFLGCCGTTCHFVEGLMAEVAAGLAAPGNARLIHRAAAEFLSRGKTPKPDEPRALETANHFQEAGLYSQALPWALTALEQMVTAMDCSGGLRLLERIRTWPVNDEDATRRMDLAAFDLNAGKGCHREALELFDKILPEAGPSVLPHILLVKARILAEMGETLSAVAVLDSILRGAKAGGEVRATVLCRLSKLFAQLGNSAKSREYQDSALEMVEKNPELMDCILGNLAMTRLLAGDTVKAEELCRKALEIHRYGGNLHHRATLLGALSIIALRTNRVEQGLEFSAAAEEIHRRSGNDKGLCSVLCNTGGMLGRVGMLEPALAALTKALEIARKIESAEMICNLTQNLGNVFTILGRYSEAEAHCRECLSTAESMGNARTMALALTSLGALNLRTGSLDEAERFFKRAERMHDRAGNIQGRATSLSGLAETYLGSGEAGRAVAPVTEAGKLAIASGDFQVSISIGFLHARILLAMGMVAEALDMYGNACREESLHGLTVGGMENKGKLERELSEKGLQISSNPDR